MLRTISRKRVKKEKELKGVLPPPAETAQKIVVLSQKKVIRNRNDIESEKKPDFEFDFGAGCPRIQN